jgi:hypothetical protein
MNNSQLKPLKNAFLAFIFLFTAISAIAQNQSIEKTNTFWQNVQFGGGLGLSFGDRFFAGTIAPSGIYNYNEHFAFGVGLNATINNLKNQYKSTILGGSLLTLYNPIDMLQVSAEFEQLHVSRNWDDSDIRDQNYWYPALFLGAGYRSSNITFGIRFDVLYDRQKSIYTDPWMPFVRFYF